MIRDCGAGTRIFIVGALDSTELFFHPFIPQNLPLVDGSHLVEVSSTQKTVHKDYTVDGSHLVGVLSTQKTVHKDHTDDTIEDFR